MKRIFFIVVSFVFIIISCNKTSNNNNDAFIDRFSLGAGFFLYRDILPTLPAPNAPIDYDNNPLLNTNLFGPTGKSFTVYNFGTVSVNPDTAFALYRPSDNTFSPLVIIFRYIPGQVGYNDFHRIDSISVPANTTINSNIGYSQIIAQQYKSTVLPYVLDLPIVPNGSIARKRINASDYTGLTQGWWNGNKVYYFTFNPPLIPGTQCGCLNTTNANMYVAFANQPAFNSSIDFSSLVNAYINGFMVESSNTKKTHNVISNLPGIVNYSPGWNWNIYNNTNFSNVIGPSALQNAQNSTIIPNSGFPAGSDFDPNNRVYNAPVVSFILN